MRLLRPIEPLRPFLKCYGWSLPGILSLGILASAVEGIGIGLFLPLLQASNGGVNSRIAARLLGWIPAAHQTTGIALCIAAALLLKSAVSYGSALLSSRVNLQVGHRLRSELFSRLINTGYTFAIQKDWAELLETLSTETWRAMQAVNCALTAAMSVGTMAVFAGLLLFLSPSQTLVIGAGMLVLSFALRGITRPVRRSGERAVLDNAVLGQRMVDGILGLRTIQAFQLQPHAQSEFEKASDDVRRAFLKVEAWSAVVGPFAEISSSLLLLGFVLFASYSTWNWPAVLVMVVVLYRLQSPFKQFETARIGLAGLSGAAERVSRLLADSQAAMEAPGRPPASDPKESITFERVHFTYPNSEHPALRDVSVRIPCGRVTALVGLSGAGKTTLLNLLCAFHRPTQGRILIDDRPLGGFDPDSWRAQIALAGQDVHLFNTSVVENIRFGRLDASREEIVEAARNADADDFIRELPEGYDTRIGDNGTRLSGGQRQRIALARAFLRKPKILVLDEATNALDSMSEHWIQSALDQFADECTVVIAAHRFSTIERADQVIVLEHGRVVEQGPVAEILKNDGIFAQLYNLQTLTAQS